jgi:hypothetical protein
VSQDALGLGASAERLAERFAPGLTINTRSVRYYQLVVAGAQIAAEQGLANSRSVVLRLEKLWALASYLADPDAGARTGSGLAGITYVRHAARLGNVRQSLNYRLFQGDSQASVGALGLYRNSAVSLLFAGPDGPTFLGRRLAEAFIGALDDAKLRRTVVSNGATAPTATLVGFGERAGLFTAIDPATADAAWAGLSSHPNRREAAKALRGAATDQAGLLRRLARTRLFKQPALAAEALEDLHSALSRLLDATVVIASSERYVDPTEVRTSPALVAELDWWKERSATAVEHLEQGQVDREVVELGQRVAGASHPWEAVEILVTRHLLVQARKGRQPWLDWRGGYLTPVAASPNLGYDPFDLDTVPRGHDFRLVNLQTLTHEITGAGVALT